MRLADSWRSCLGIAGEPDRLADDVAQPERVGFPFFGLGDQRAGDAGDCAAEWRIRVCGGRRRCRRVLALPVGDYGVGATNVGSGQRRGIGCGFGCGFGGLPMIMAMAI